MSMNININMNINMTINMNINNINMSNVDKKINSIKENKLNIHK